MLTPFFLTIFFESILRQSLSLVLHRSSENIYEGSLQAHWWNTAAKIAGLHRTFSEKEKIILQKLVLVFVVFIKFELKCVYQNFNFLKF